jgi:hypothetical protein
MMNFSITHGNMMQALKPLAYCKYKKIYRSKFIYFLEKSHDEINSKMDTNFEKVRRLSRRVAFII